MNQAFFEDPCDALLLGMISSFTHAHTHSSLLDGRIFLCFSLDKGKARNYKFIAVGTG